MDGPIPPRTGGNRTRGEASGASPSRVTLASLLLNQTIGLLAAGVLLGFFLWTDRGRRLTERSAAVAHTGGWLRDRLSTVHLYDLPVGLLLALLLLAWVLLYQRYLVLDRPVSQAEWKPSSGRERVAAVYLLFVPAVMEELLFRGVLLPGIAYLTSPWVGVAGSSVLFGLAHYEKGLSGVPAVVGYGCILGAALVMGSSLWVCILAHGVLNGAAFFIGGRYRKEGDEIP